MCLCVCLSNTDTVLSDSVSGCYTSENDTVVNMRTQVRPTGKYHNLRLLILIKFTGTANDTTGKLYCVLADLQSDLYLIASNRSVFNQN